MALLLLTELGDVIWSHSCRSCVGPWTERAGATAWTGEVLRVPLRPFEESRCPPSPRLDKRASLLPTSHLPVAASPLILCLHVERDGSVDTFRTLYGEAAYDGTGVATSDIRRLRFRPATAMGKSVAAWVAVSIGADTVPYPVL
ncbi:MAG TPA: hypothetical protein VKI45_05685 [Allosphingosinicella sp.]|nr:hypothetical protein [Allosphingosinicella sp.]